LEELSPEDTFWSDWQESHPERHAELEDAKALVLAFQFEQIPTDPAEIKTAIKAILYDIQSEKKPTLYRSLWFRLCASVALALGVLYWISNELITKQEINSKDIVQTYLSQSTPLSKRSNRSKKIQRLILKDGSTVLLDTASTLQISDDFGQDKREVFLEGSAVFDVTKDPQRPFLVNTGELVTKVLGTSFLIRAYSVDADVQVAVKTGKVTVYKSKKTPHNNLSEEIILTPNQQAIYLKSDNTLIKTLVGKPMKLHEPVKFRNFEYNEAPIPQVLTDLEEVYGVKIFFDEQLMKECNLTAKLTNEPLFVQLTMICETIQASYEIIDGQIVISGKGCQ
jgi:ferric-dicitrate binding protein FerR (iron transport regulator)